MANATEKAPLKEQKVVELFGVKVKEGSNEYLALTQEFDVNKKYEFQLAMRVQEREQPIINLRTKRPEPHKEFNKYRNLILSSQIVWNGQRVNIRYYDGCDTIFNSAQPKEKDVIDQLIQQSKRRAFIDGKLVIDGYDKMLLLYMNIASWNGESKFRTSNANAIFIAVNPDKVATEESIKMDKIEEALELAKNATEQKMMIHANYLGIPTIEFNTGNPKSPAAIRSEYRKRALKDADGFIKSYGNKSIEVKYYIDKALLDGTINNKLNANKAAWSNSNNVICDISGLKSNEAIADRLYEFSQLEEGEEFLIQLKAIYN